MTEVHEDEDTSPVVTERVQVLAKGIYDEFQSMVGHYGPESIGNLMPLVVNVLENLDSALADNKDYLTALEETNEENQQLSVQFQKEKQRRKELEEKSMMLEDVNDVEFRKLRSKISSLSLENKNLSTKNTTQKEQIERLEERHDAVKKEKNELYDKHIEMIKNYHTQLETLKQSAARRAEVRSKSSEDYHLDSPATPRAPGFMDFTAPPKGQEGKKKRQLPIAPKRKNRTTSGEGEEELFLATTPFQRVESPEYSQHPHGLTDPFDPNYMSIHEEQQQQLEAEAEEEGRGSDGTLDEEEPALREMGEQFAANEDSLLAEIQLAQANPALDELLRENEKLHSEKNDLTREIDELLAKYRETEADRMSTQNSLNALSEDKQKMTVELSTKEAEIKKLRAELEEERDKGAIEGEGQVIEGPEGLKLTRLEVARVLRERNEYKEKYLSLLEQIRMSDELSLFKAKKQKSRWLDYFAAVFSPAKRRQLEQNFADSTPRRPILSRHSGNPGLGGTDEEDGGTPQAGGAGYRKTNIIPILKKTGKRQDEVYMTSVSWVIPTMDQQILEDKSLHPQPHTPSINTCRPMSYQEEGAKILCAASVNPATFVEDYRDAVSVLKEASPNAPQGSKPDANTSISLVWIVTGVPNLTKVSVIDVAAVGDVLDTFPVCASPISCITAVPEFDSKDPDVLAGLSNTRRKEQPDFTDRPSSKQATMWMGSDSGVLYVHSAVSNWKKCIHADKLPAAIVNIAHFKGKTFILLVTSKLLIFRRFTDGEWDWDNYSMMMLTQRRDTPSSSLATVKYNIWCAIGNTVHVVQPHQLKMEATFQVHQGKNAVVTNMLCVGEGVWIAFKMDSILKLYNASSFAHMQDLNIAPSIHQILLFGSEKHSSKMPIQVSTLVAAHSSLWVGTENGVLISYPFTSPVAVAEESGWEVIKEAEVGGQPVPEPFDVRTEEGLEAGVLPLIDLGGIETSHDSGRSSDRSLTHSVTSSPKPVTPRVPKLFNPFCNVDQVELSIHCHINAVKCLLCVPGLVPKDLSVFEPLGGVYIGSGDSQQCKPTLFVVSCGEGHLDLRTADKVLQTLQAKENGQSGLPSPATIISEKNYVMVWDINN